MEDVSKGHFPDLKGQQGIREEAPAELSTERGVKKTCRQTEVPKDKDSHSTLGEE